MDVIRLTMLKFAKLFAVPGLLSGTGGQYTNAKYSYYPTATGDRFFTCQFFYSGTSGC